MDENRVNQARQAVEENRKRLHKVELDQEIILFELSLNLQSQLSQEYIGTLAPTADMLCSQNLTNTIAEAIW